MVTLTEVEDEHFQGQQPGPADDDDFTDTDSEISNDSDFDPADETLAERLSALKDIIPPTTRGWIAGHVSSVSSSAWSALSFSGKAGWVIATSVLFIGVPFTLSFAEDQQLMAVEQEYNQRQAGGEMLTGGGDQTTAEKVGAAIGDGQARPSL